MKKYFTFGLILSLVSGACFAQHPRVEQLLQEKQQKMDKLQKCKGTTKDLKIAGISTLSITAVGVGANIAEAVVLSDKKGDIKDAKKKYEAEKTIKENREAAEKKAREEALKKAQEEQAAQKVLAEKCEELSGKLSASKNTCNVTKTGMTSDEMNKAVEQELKTFTEEEVFNCRDDKKTPKRTLTCTDNHKNTINLVYESSVAAPVAAAKPAEATKPADKKAEAAKTADKKPAETKPAEKKAEAKAAVAPKPEDKKPESVSEQKKIDDAFLKACTGEYKPNPKNNGENSCVIHVKDPVSKADMESVATDKKFDDTICPNDKVYDSGTKAKMFNCATGTMPNRLYVMFDNIENKPVTSSAPEQKKTDPVAEKPAAEEAPKTETAPAQDSTPVQDNAPAEEETPASPFTGSPVYVQDEDEYTTFEALDWIESWAERNGVKLDCSKADAFDYSAHQVTCEEVDGENIQTFIFRTLKEQTQEEKDEADKAAERAAKFAKVCEAYGHDARIDSDGVCTSNEFTEITDISAVDTTLEPLKAYWEGRQPESDNAEGSYKCDKIYDEDDDDFVKYYYSCYGMDSFYDEDVNTAGVKIAKSICGDGKTLDVVHRKCITNEEAKPQVEWKQLCEGYGHGAYVYNGNSCNTPTNSNTIVETIDQITPAHDALDDYWTEKGFTCNKEIFDRDDDYRFYWKCTKDDYTVYTSHVIIVNPCESSMGEDAMFNSSNLTCYCPNNYKEDANGKCVKVDCAENEFFDNSDKTCKECAGNQAAAAGDNVCKPFNCPHTNWQVAKGHMCQWFTPNTEVIDRFKRGEGVEHEYESVEKGMEAIYAFDSMFKSCDCNPEPGTPHTVAWEDDYISCTCKDGAEVSKTIRFVFEDLED